MINNFGLQPLSATLNMSADSSGDGPLSLIRLLELATVAAGDSAAIIDSLIMPHTGVQRLCAELEIADDDSRTIR